MSATQEQKEVTVTTEAPVAEEMKELSATEIAEVSGGHRKLSKQDNAAKVIALTRFKFGSKLR